MVGMRERKSRMAHESQGGVLEPFCNHIIEYSQELCFIQERIQFVARRSTVLPKESRVLCVSDVELVICTVSHVSSGCGVLGTESKGIPSQRHKIAQG